MPDFPHQDVEAVLSFVRARHRLSDDELDELRSEVHLKLLENDSEVLRRWDGSGPLRNYLGVVISRVHLDYRRKIWGKWRASAEALRLGPVALRMEELVYREGFSYGEAVGLLRDRYGFAEEDAELERIWARLPTRYSRREEDLGDHEDRLAAQDDPQTEALRREKAERLARLKVLIDEYCAGLPGEDAMILRLHLDDVTTADIARDLGLEQRPLYRRIPAIKKGLQRLLRAEGFGEIST